MNTEARGKDTAGVEAFRKQEHLKVGPVDLSCHWALPSLGWLRKSAGPIHMKRQGLPGQGSQYPLSG